ncbi:MAG: hypothetical protein L6264_01330 [Weeksellaceae bacterium]|nr:hypothetical protein [Bacteroidota bacterium]MCG2779563.1 hypothetical protein [Weeksellaceae bacterium]
MKKLLFLIPLIVFSCSRKKEVSEIPVKNNQPQSVQEKTEEKPADGVQISKDVKSAETPQDISRITEGDKIIRTVNRIPAAISDEFTDDRQQLIIKIKDFDRQNISGKITPENPQMNIRFNQIKLPDGSYDGPFGKELMYKSREMGEVWLMIGKSNMASGETKGKFTVALQ